jgi:glycosyltransferase involved in cell wall biosynthesis
MAAYRGCSVADISILMPSYGYGRFVGDTVDAIIHQDAVSPRCVFQDAGSENETSDVHRSFAHRVEWPVESDLGQSNALNKALTTDD